MAFQWSFLFDMTANSSPRNACAQVRPRTDKKQTSPNVVPPKYTYTSTYLNEYPRKYVYIYILNTYINEYTCVCVYVCA